MDFGKVFAATAIATLVMGLNAFFACKVCLGMAIPGSGRLPDLSPAMLVVAALFIVKMLLNVIA